MRSLKTKDISDTSQISKRLKDTDTTDRLQRLTDEIKRLPSEKIDELEHLVKAMGKRALNLKEAALMLNVSVITLRRAIKSGTIKAFRLHKTATYRISIEELDQFISGRKSSSAQNLN